MARNRPHRTIGMAEGAEAIRRGESTQFKPDLRNPAKRRCRVRATNILTPALTGDEDQPIVLTQ